MPISQGWQGILKKLQYINLSHLFMLQIYNTLSSKIEPLSPIKKGKINLFVCGPTVYDYSHIGHARTYVAFDMFVNYLKHLGFDVFYLQNITDIDDKIIKRAKEKNVSPKELAYEFEKEYMADMKTLQVKSITKYARATEHIKQIISQVERLLVKGFAYQTSDGIYYDVSKFIGYGKLSGRTVEGAEDGTSRIDEGVAKKNKADFCLWKLALSEAKEFEPSWPSPWGAGRPGWHIEDTAITEKYFGAQYDIHGGARDLIFPHHEAEISQMEAISGKSPLVKYWIHTGFLTIDGQKMSKSLGNFTTIRDFLKQNTPQTLRMFIFSSHYRSPIDLKDTSIAEAKANVEKLQDLITKLQEVKLLAKEPSKEFNSLQEKFWDELENDFNTPKAKAMLFEIANLANEKISKNELTQEEAEEILKFLKKINKIFLFLDFKKKKEAEIPEEIKKLAKQREKFRQAKEWQKADEMRNLTASKGWSIYDTDNGYELKPKDPTID
ncbi:MAG: cysteine--tRNA ligase [Candidatus Pacebacteria bacterium]|nr:cysteine--tRNA ligase [Candidatus Paceibacterota bacterium]